MNSLERQIRRALRQPRNVPDWLPLDPTISEALRACATKRSERSRYRAKKEIIERLAQIVSNSLRDTTRRDAGRSHDAMPIALPMVDRLIPEPIAPDDYRGPDRGRALSAAALGAEMSGRQQSADSLISQASNNVRNQFDRRDIACAFEVAQNELFIARCRGNLQAMRAAVRTMTRLYDRLSPHALVKYALDCSEVYLYEGRLRDARSELDCALLNASPGDGTLLKSITLVRKAQIALARRDLSGAVEAGIAAAKLGRPHADIRVYAAEVLARASLQTRSRWSSEGLEDCQSAFHSLSVRTLLARHELQRGKTNAAYETAKDSYDEAMRLRYWNLASRSASTLALFLSSREAKVWLAQALRLHLHSNRQNAYVGNDLFEVGPRSSHLMRAFLESDDAVALMAEVYFRRFPNSIFKSPTEPVLSRIALFMLHGSLRLKTMAACDVLSSAAKRWSQQSIGLEETEREVRRLGSLMCSLSILLPFEQRGEFIAVNRRQTYTTLHTLRRSLARYHWMALRCS